MRGITRIFGVILSIVAWGVIFGPVSHELRLRFNSPVTYVPGFENNPFMNDGRSPFGDSIIVWLTLISSIVVTFVIWAVIVEITREPPPPPPPPPKCPKCGSLFHSIVSSRTESYDTTETETRRVDHYNLDDERTGYSEHEIEVPVTRYYTVYTHRCDSCHHEWTMTN